MRPASRTRPAGLRSDADAVVRTAAGRAPVDGAAVAVVAVLVRRARRQRHAGIACAIALLAEKGVAAGRADGLHLDVGKIEARGSAIFALAADVTVRQRRRRRLARTAPSAHVAELVRQRAMQRRIARLSSTAQRDGVETLADAAGRRRRAYGRALARAVLIRGALPGHRGAVGTRQQCKARRSSPDSHMAPPSGTVVGHRSRCSGN